MTHSDDQEGREPGADWGVAFTEICDTHRGRLVRWLTTIFGPRDAEDIAQEALARLYVRPGLVTDAEDAWPWLAVVARNVGRDMARHNALATTIDAHDFAHLPGDLRVWEQVSARDDADRLARALGRLNAHDRTLIRLRDMQGLTVGEIAGRMGANENTVRQQLFRARRKLQHAYVALGGDRRGGLVALLGYRAREVVRRWLPYADALAPSSGVVLAAALPVVGALVGGPILGFGAATHRAAHPAPWVAVRPGNDARDTAGHGLLARRGSAFADAVEHRPEDPILTTHQDVGPAYADITYYRKPYTTTHKGPVSHGRIGVPVPIVGGEIYWEWDEWKPSEGPNPVCQVPTVECD